MEVWTESRRRPGFLEKEPAGSRQNLLKNACFKTEESSCSAQKSVKSILAVGSKEEEDGVQTTERK